MRIRWFLYLALPLEENAIDFEEVMSKTRIYFPSLNGLRFFAALAVIFTHIELIKRFLGFGSHWRDMDKVSFDLPLNAVLHREISWITPLIANSGPLGVVFFFVLSGFLITYLLFAEKEVTSKISIRDFYMRRILRIWPLYFLMVFLGFFVLNQIDLFDVPIQRVAIEKNYWTNLLLFIFFLPNLAFSLSIAVPNIGQLWSIGVEEQFYIIWPWIVKKAKRFLKAMLIFTFGLIIFKVLVLVLASGNSGYWMGVVKKFVAMSKLECMSLGGIGAYYLYFKREKIQKWIDNKWLFGLAVLSVPLLIYLTPKSFQNGVYLIYSVASLIIILHLSCATKPALSFENKVLDFLGKISFGIYMYHMMVTVFVVHVVRDYLHFDRDMSPSQNLFVYAVVVALTLLIASISYLYFEKYFIEKKKSVSKVVSGENAK